MVVDPTEPESFTEPAQTSEPSQPESDLDALSDVGDIAELADTRYREWVWWVYRMRPQAEIQKDPRARKRVVVTKVVGPLDVLDIRDRFGGGVYEFRGFLGGEMQLRKEFELEGPLTPPPAPALPAPAPPAPNGNGTELLAVLGRIEQRLNAPAPPAPAAQGMTLDDILKILALVKPSEPAVNPGEMLKGLADAFKWGADLRGQAEGGNEKSIAEIAIEKLAPAAERIATALMTRRAPGGPRPPVHAASRAVVVETPTAAAPAPRPTEPEGVNYRITAAVDALARAIANDDEPGDFADSLDHILDPTELAWLASKSADEVLSELAPVTARFPVFSTEPARVFVESVLAELRTPQGVEPTSA